mmetsp:Transcript_20107/g.30091  ORF Transcript_20107/g.30091 Transcript_20107/m.30091 type:complete len:192 (+) Transcript_20107:151-726(+)
MLHKQVRSSSSTPALSTLSASSQNSASGRAGRLPQYQTASPHDQTSRPPPPMQPPERKPHPQYRYSPKDFETSQQRAFREFQSSSQRLGAQGCLEVSKSGLPLKPERSSPLDLTRSSKLSAVGSPLQVHREMLPSVPVSRLGSPKPGGNLAELLAKYETDTQHRNVCLGRFLVRNPFGGFCFGSGLAAQKP